MAVLRDRFKMLTYPYVCCAFSPPRALPSNMIEVLKALQIYFVRSQKSEGREKKYVSYRDTEDTEDKYLFLDRETPDKWPYGI